MDKNQIARPTDTYKITPGKPNDGTFAPAEMEAFEVAAHFGTELSKGLSKQQTRRARMKYGTNMQSAEYDESFGHGIKNQLSDVCLPLTAISLLIYSAFASGEEIYTPLAAILTVVMLVGAVLEKFAAASLNKSLRNTAMRSSVLRGGKVVSINSVALVPGDIILLESGTIVPADARLTESAHLSVLETPVTGVKTSTEKDAEYIADSENRGSYNMVYAGTIVTAGRGTAVVCRTGKECRLYKQSGDPEQKLPKVYRRAIHGGRILSLAASGACFVSVVIGLLMRRPLAETYITATAVAMCGMQSLGRVLMLTGFASGVKKMYKNSAVLKHPEVIDTLCEADTVMCDKAVAFPMSELQPRKIYINRDYYEVCAANTDSIKKVLTLALLCSDVRRSGSAAMIGDGFYGMPADVSLARACDEIGINIDSFYDEYFRIEAEYDRNGEIVRALYLHDDSNLLIMRGKPEDILPLCAGYDAQGTNNRFDDYSLRRMKTAAEDMGNSSQHVIAVASAVCDCDSLRNTAIAERRLVLNGFIGLYTSLKLDSASAVYKCAAGGIETVMLSEDAYVTAVSMAKHAGIITSEKQVMSAEELYHTDRGLYIADSENYKLFLNLNDEQWLDVLNIRKSKGHIIAVTAHNTDRLSLMKAADATFAPADTSPETVKYAADVLLYKTGLKTVEAVLRASKMIYKRIVGVSRQLYTAAVALFAVFVSALFTGLQSPLRLQDILLCGVCINPLLAASAAFASDHRKLLEDKTDYSGKPRGLIFSTAYGLAVTAGTWGLSLLLDRMGSAGGSRNTAMLLGFAAFMTYGLLFGAEQQHIYRSSAFKSTAVPIGAAAALFASVLPALIPSTRRVLGYALPSYEEALTALVLPTGVFALCQFVLIGYEIINLYTNKNRKGKHNEIH